MAEIYFIIESETIGISRTFILQGAKQDNEIVFEGEPGGTQRYAALVPLGILFGALVAELARANGIREGSRVPRGVQLSTSPAAKEILAELMGVEDFAVSAQTIIKLPPTQEAIEEITEGTEAGQELVAGVIAEAEARARTIARARTLKRLTPKLTQRQALAASVLREYKMYGQPELADQDVMDILAELGLDGVVEVGAAPEEEVEVPPAPLRIPYGEFALGEATGCLVKGLIGKYSGLPSSRRIAPSAIEAWFSEDKGGPSLMRLKEFAVKYAIPLRVFDIMGTEVFELAHHNAGAKTGKRPGLALIAYNNHAYFYTKTLNVAPSFSRTVPDHDIEGYHSSSFLQIKEKGELRDPTAEENQMLEAAIALDRPNFSFASEGRVGGRNLMFTDPRFAGTGHECEGHGATPCPYVGWDMNKAYHTAVMATGATCPPLDKYLARQVIPIFTVMDDYYMAAESAAFPPRASWDLTYFFLSEAALQRWRLAGGHKAGRVTNFLTGMEYAYLRDRNQIGPEDIQGWKTASYSLPEQKLRAWLNKLDSDTRDFEELLGLKDGGTAFRSRFALMNGLLGRTWTRPQQSGLITANEQDLDLLALTHPAAMDEEEVQEGKTSVTITSGRRKYLWLNARHLYNHVIGRMNLFMMQLVDDISMLSPAAELLKLKVDAVVYNQTVELPGWAVPLFKPETPKLKSYTYSAVVHEIAKVSESIQAEIDEMISRCVTYTGPPGTGKTTRVHKEAQYDVALAFSNVCARNLDHETPNGFIKGQTLHSGLGLSQVGQLEIAIERLKNKSLWVDEFSTVQSWIWSILAALLQRGLKVLILTGDPNQTPPVMETFRHKAMFTRSLLKGATILTEDYRNDAELIKLRNFIVETPETKKSNIITFLGRLTELRPFISMASICEEGLAEIDVHITHTNSLRMAINRFIVQKRGLDYKYTELPGAKRAGKMWVASKWLRLRARVTRKALKIYKGAIYELVEAVTPASRTVELRRVYLDASVAPSPPFTIAIRDFAIFELGYALTAHSAIGQTVRGQRLAIHQMRQMVQIDKSILYVAITRACRLVDLVLGLEIPEWFEAQMDRYIAEDEANAVRAPIDDEPEPNLRQLAHELGTAKFVG